MRIAVVGSRSVSVAVALPIIHSFFQSGQWSWSSVVSGGGTVKFYVSRISHNIASKVSLTFLKAVTGYLL